MHLDAGAHDAAVMADQRLDVVLKEVFYENVGDHEGAGLGRGRIGQVVEVLRHFLSRPDRAIPRQGLVDVVDRLRTVFGRKVRVALAQPVVRDLLELDHAVAQLILQPDAGPVALGGVDLERPGQNALQQIFDVREMLLGGEDAVAADVGRLGRSQPGLRLGDLLLVSFFEDADVQPFVLDVVPQLAGLRGRGVDLRCVLVRHQVRVAVEGGVTDATAEVLERDALALAAPVVETGLGLEPQALDVAAFSRHVAGAGQLPLVADRAEDVVGGVHPRGLDQRFDRHGVRLVSACRRVADMDAAAQRQHVLHGGLPLGEREHGGAVYDVEWQLLDADAGGCQPVAGKHIAATVDARIAANLVGGSGRERAAADVHVIEALGRGRRHCVVVVVAAYHVVSLVEVFDLRLGIEHGIDRVTAGAAILGVLEDHAIVAGRLRLVNFLGVADGALIAGVNCDGVGSDCTRFDVVAVKASVVDAVADHLVRANVADEAADVVRGPALHIGHGAEAVGRLFPHFVEAPVPQHVGVPVGAAIVAPAGLAGMRLFRQHIAILDNARIGHADISWANLRTVRSNVVAQRFVLDLWAE